MLLGQLGLVILLAVEAAALEYEFPASIWIVLARFFCGTVLHFILQDEMRQGLAMMKFSLNHHWKFKSMAQAWMIGLAQTTMVVVVEGVNIVMLC